MVSYFIHKVQLWWGVVLLLWFPFECSYSIQTLLIL